MIEKLENHPLPPFLPQNARILLLGSFPPPKKRWCIDFFYPNFNNDMWRVFGLVFFADPLHFIDTEHKCFRKQDIVDFLSEKRIGIYDTACQVIRQQDNASDKFLEVVTPTDIEFMLRDYPECRTLITTGQKATDILCAYYSVDSPSVGGYVEVNSPRGLLRIYRMPSTSRAYPLSLVQKAAVYKKVLCVL
ncbi:MAG: uracil-DNA glycosylase family protein [Paludibacteraceae bacterium]|nr:uracil-DNA glycosylase family protein [Paludibacteraceae bacterium]